jgi:AraC-like DNA-binding protein
VDAWICLLCGFLSLTLAAGEFLSREKYPGRGYLAFGYVVYGCLLLQIWAFQSRWLYNAPHLLFLGGVLMMLHGWSFPRFLRRRLGLELASESGDPLHQALSLWPSLVTLLFLTPVIFQAPELKLARMERMFDGPRDPLDLSAPIALALGMLYQAWGVGVTLCRTRGLGDSAALPAVRAFRGFALAVLVHSLIGAALMFAGWRMGLTLFTTATALMIPVFHITSRRYTDFFQNVSDEIRGARYGKSRLRGLDLDDLRTRLDRLMETEELYRNEKLTLETLAEGLEISAHQLSEFLNAKLGASFSAYINGLRIDRARRLLETAPELPIMSIAYDSGFGAKSTFNTAFRAATGRTPSQYRRKFHQR